MQNQEEESLQRGIKNMIFRSLMRMITNPNGAVIREKRV